MENLCKSLFSFPNKATHIVLASVGQAVYEMFEINVSIQENYLGAGTD